MAYKPPTSYVAMRPLTLKGVAYAKNANIPIATMQAVKDANSLVSRGWIKPIPDPHRRRGGVTGKWRPGPTTVHVALQK